MKKKMYEHFILTNHAQIQISKQATTNAKKLVIDDIFYICFSNAMSK